MNGLSIIIFAIFTVFAAAMCGLVLADMLFGAVRHSWSGLVGRLLLAVFFGGSALFCGSAALKMAAAAIAGAAI